MNLTKVKQLLERIISIHQEIDTLNEELKDIKTVVEEELPEMYRPKVLLQDGNIAIDVTKTTLPANGSKGKVSFEENNNDFGTFSRLKNVLVTEMIEYKKGGGNAADEFGLEVQGASDFNEAQETNTTPKQPKPTTVPDEDDSEGLPF